MAVSASSLQNTGDKNWMTVAATCVNSPEQLRGVISEFATIIHGLYIAKSSPTSPELNPLRFVYVLLAEMKLITPPQRVGINYQLIDCFFDVGMLSSSFLKIRSRL